MIKSLLLLALSLTVCDAFVKWISRIKPAGFDNDNDFAKNKDMTLFCGSNAYSNSASVVRCFTHSTEKAYYFSDVRDTVRGKSAAFFYPMGPCSFDENYPRLPTAYMLMDTCGDIVQFYTEAAAVTLQAPLGTYDPLFDNPEWVMCAYSKCMKMNFTPGYKPLGSITWTRYVLPKKDGVGTQNSGVTAKRGSSRPGSETVSPEKPSDAKDKDTGADSVGKIQDSKNKPGRGTESPEKPSDAKDKGGGGNQATDSAAQEQYEKDGSQAENPEEKPGTIDKGNSGADNREKNSYASDKGADGTKAIVTTSPGGNGEDGSGAHKPGIKAGAGEKSDIGAQANDVTAQTGEGKVSDGNKATDAPAQRNGGEEGGESHVTQEEDETSQESGESHVTQEEDETSQDGDGTPSPSADAASGRGTKEDYIGRHKRPAGGSDKVGGGSHDNYVPATEGNKQSDRTTRDNDVKTAGGSKQDGDGAPSPSADAASGRGTKEDYKGRKSNKRPAGGSDKVGGGFLGNDVTAKKGKKQIGKTTNDNDVKTAGGSKQVNEDSSDRDGSAAGGNDQDPDDDGPGYDDPDDPAYGNSNQLPQLDFGGTSISPVTENSQTSEISKNLQIDKAKSGTDISRPKIEYEVYCDRAYSCLTCTSGRVCGATKDGTKLQEIGRFSCTAMYPYCNYTTGSCTDSPDPACWDPPATVEAKDFICMREGFYPDPHSCERYYSCRNQIAYEHFCPYFPTPYYHPGLRICVPTNEFCTDKTTSHLCKHPNNFGKKIPIVPTNNYFMACGVNEKIPLAIDRCIGKYIFDPEVQICRFECPYAGLFLNAFDCSQYIKCTSLPQGGFLRTDMTCPEDKAFLESESSCVDRSLVRNCDGPFLDFFV